jgi:undecaprenyl-diphosphatase
VNSKNASRASVTTTRAGDTSETNDVRVPGAVPRRELRTVIGVVVTFMVCLLAGALLGAVVLTLSGAHGATTFDARITNWFVQHRSDVVTSIMRVITALGGTVVVVAVTSVAVFVLVVANQVRTAAFLVTAAVGGSILSALIKALVGRERPPTALRLAHVVSASFPSGHATQAAATYLALAVIAGSYLRRTWVPAAWSGAITIVLAVGITRVYLGVHWATDVLGGWLLGTLWVVGLTISLRPLRPSMISELSAATDRES